MDEKEIVTVNEALPAAPDLKKAKKDFSRLGFSLLGFFAVISLLQFGAGYLLARPGMPESPLLQWTLGYIVPLYVIGVPVALLLMRGVPAERIEAQKLSGKQFFLFLLMCFPIMYGGNLIGTLLSAMFSSGSAENPLTGVVMDSSWIQVIVLAVLAPLFEEFIFRKQLIDRIGRYGEKTAIFFSGLTFGLFHGNLYQFFYAFGLGLLFAYIYTRTRKLRYSVILHMCINFLGSVVAPWILKQSDMSGVEALWRLPGRALDRGSGRADPASQRVPDPADGRAAAAGHRLQNLLPQLGRDPLCGRLPWRFCFRAAAVKKL